MQRLERFHEVVFIGKTLAAPTLVMLESGISWGSWPANFPDEAVPETIWIYLFDCVDYFHLNGRNICSSINSSQTFRFLQPLNCYREFQPKLRNETNVETVDCQQLRSCFYPVNVSCYELQSEYLKFGHEWLRKCSTNYLTSDTLKLCMKWIRRIAYAASSKSSFNGILSLL